MVTAKTFRKVTNITAAGGGSSERVVIKLTVQVENTDFDPIGESDPVHASTSCITTLTYNHHPFKPLFVYAEGRGACLKDKSSALSKQSFKCFDFDTASV